MGPLPAGPGRPSDGWGALMRTVRNSNVCCSLTVTVPSRLRSAASNARFVAALSSAATVDLPGEAALCGAALAAGAGAGGGGVALATASSF